MFDAPNAATVAAFLGVLTAMTSAWIAWQQHKATRTKLRLDLYDRRFAVFTACIQLISRVVQNARVEIADLHEFNKETNQALFLFDDELVKYIDSLRDRALAFRSRREQLERPELIPPALWPQVVEEEAELLRWITEQLSMCRQRFRPYLRFSEAH